MTVDQKASETPEFEQITPAKIDISPQTGETAQSEQRGSNADPVQQRNWFLLALLALLIFAGLLFWTLPKIIDKPTVVIEPPQTASPGRSSPASSPQMSPWQEAQLGRERKITQEILAEFLDRQFDLEEKRVELWGATEFEQAKAKAQAGDEAYRAQEFRAASEHYREGLSILDGLVERAETVVEDYLAAGATALLDGNSAAAREAFELVLNVEPLNSTAAKGLERAQSLDQVFSLYGAALAAESGGDLDESLELLNQALQIDPDFHQALQSRNEVKGKILEREYAAAMSLGFNQLAAGKYSAADAAFRRALSLKPGSAEAKDGINQVALTLTQNKIAKLEEQAADFEANEEWKRAKDTYETVLGMDSSVVFAQEGVARTATRVRLDDLLEEARSNPQRLSTPEVNRETRQLLAVARTVQSPGKRLQQQISEIEAALDKALEPVPVTLISDNQTDVTLYKVGHLGSFESHQLSLRPGTYAIVGRRLGYRDVRKEFVVARDAETGPIAITCTEKI